MSSVTLNFAAAMPYFYAAASQFAVGATSQIAGLVTKRRNDKLLLEPMIYQPVGKGFIPDGTLMGLVIPEELSPDTILTEAGRDRDIATIVTGVLFVIAPILLTSSILEDRPYWIIIALVVLVVLMAWSLRKWQQRLKARRARPGIVLTSIAVGLLILVNLVAGFYTLATAPTNPTVPTTSTPANP